MALHRVIQVLQYGAWVEPNWYDLDEQNDTLLFGIYPANGNVMDAYEHMIVGAKDKENVNWRWVERVCVDG